MRVCGCATEFLAKLKLAFFKCQIFLKERISFLVVFYMIYLLCFFLFCFISPSIKCKLLRADHSLKYSKHIEYSRHDMDICANTKFSKQDRHILMGKITHIQNFLKIHISLRLIFSHVKQLSVCIFKSFPGESDAYHKCLYH